MHAGAAAERTESSALLSLLLSALCSQRSAALRAAALLARFQVSGHSRACPSGLDWGKRAVQTRRKYRFEPLDTQTLKKSLKKACLKNNARYG